MMLEKVKKIFKNSKLKISFLFLVFSGLVAPKSASAWWIFPSASDVVDMTANSIIALIFSIILGACSVFLGLAQFCLNKVISSDFITISFTGPDNIIVQTGWIMVRDFTNMFIVLGFVIIALATILRIKEYQAQKLLPLLIGIALLINFTPVICGFIIDVSNITMNHFLRGAGIHDSYLLNSIWNQCAQLNNIFDNEPTETLAMGLMFSGFAITAGVIYFLFAVLFIFRYIALWCLIILSPLAFFCYIFPGVKSIWTLWWNQFFQWCIIGIPAAFFLYLSKILTKMVEDGSLTGTHGVENAGFEIMISYLVIIVFLVMGFLFSLKTGAMGANIATSATQKAVKGTANKAGKWAGNKVKTFAKERIPSRALRAAERVSTWSPKEGGKLDKLIKKTETDGHIKGAGRYVARKAVGATGWAGRKLAAPGIANMESQRKDIAIAKKQALERSHEANLLTLRDPLTSKAVLVGTTQALIEKKGFKKLKKLGFRKEEKENLMKKVGKYAIKIHPEEFSKIRDANPKLIQDIAHGKDVITGKFGFDENVLKRSGLTLDEDDIKLQGIESLYEKTIAGLNSEDLKQLDMSEVISDEFQEVFHKHADGAKIAALSKQFGKTFVDKFQAVAAKNGRDHYLKPETFNPNVVNYLKSNTAGSAGYSSIGEKVEGGERVENKKKADNYKQNELILKIYYDEEKNNKQDIVLEEKDLEKLEGKIQELVDKGNDRSSEEAHELEILLKHETIYKEILKSERAEEKEIKY
ncbi:MAG: hypothetical protein U9Q27_03675 [Patescibacteria group bacterium]|nr:hypothetical protein [Patescibacteria group bacterium]